MPRTEPSFRRRLNWLIPGMRAEARALERAGDSGTLRFLLPSPFSPEEKADLVKFYEDRLKQGAEGRRILASITALSPDSCPFCGTAGEPETFEHMFPKAQYPWLSAEPLNLAPCCWPCNVGRKSLTPQTSPNPYFDVWLRKRWLIAKVVDVSSPGVVEYELDAAADLEPHQIALLSKHISDRRLKRRLPVQAATAFADHLGSFRTVQTQFSLSSTRLATYIGSSLSTSADDRARRFGENHWEAVALRCWASAASGIDWVKLLT